MYVYCMHVALMLNFRYYEIMQFIKKLSNVNLNAISKYLLIENKISLLVLFTLL